jgi:hypothetical protein
MTLVITSTEFDPTEGEDAALDQQQPMLTTEELALAAIPAETIHEAEVLISLFNDTFSDESDNSESMRIRGVYASLNDDFTDSTVNGYLLSEVRPFIVGKIKSLVESSRLRNDQRLDQLANALGEIGACCMYGTSTPEIIASLRHTAALMRELKEFDATPAIPDMPEEVRLQAIRLLEEGCTYFAVEKATGLPYETVKAINLANGDRRGC